MNSIEKDMNELLREAAAVGCVPALDEYLQAGADPNAKDEHKATALHKAAESRDDSQGIGLERLLTIKGIEINAQDAEGNTAIHLATQSGSKAKVQKLLDQGADINVVNASGLTPLMIAAQEGYGRVTQLLLDRNADVGFSNEDGLTAYRCAKKDSSVARMIKKKLMLNRELVDAAQVDDVEKIKKLLEQGADVNAYDRCHNTPLAGAVWEGNSETVELLLEKGADVNAHNKYGSTALALAIKKGDPEKTKMLLDRGADLNLADDAGVTSRELAAKLNYKPILEIINNYEKKAPLCGGRVKMPRARLSSRLGFKEHFCTPQKPSFAPQRNGI